MGGENVCLQKTHTHTPQPPAARKIELFIGPDLGSQHEEDTREAV